MKKNNSSSMSVKGQTTIPSKVRDYMNISPGDTISYIMENNEVKIQKVKDIDLEWASAVEGTLNEWKGTEDDDL